MLRSGLTVVLDRLRPLAERDRAKCARSTSASQRRGAVDRAAAPPDSVPLLDFFDRGGYSLVAGRAALVPVGADPATTVAARRPRRGGRASSSTAPACPPGALGLDEGGADPGRRRSRRRPRQTLLGARAPRRARGRVDRRGPADLERPREDRVARFSSTRARLRRPGEAGARRARGRARHGRPGSERRTARPRFGTVSGTSAAAAVVAGAAALLAQARPELDAAAL